MKLVSNQTNSLLLGKPSKGLRPSFRMGPDWMLPRMDSGDEGMREHSVM